MRRIIFLFCIILLVGCGENETIIDENGLDIIEDDIIEIEDETNLENVDKDNEDIEEGLEIECISKSDCVTGGCSGEICGLKEVDDKVSSTCIFKPEYDCLKLTTCGCIEGKCQFEDNSNYRGCLNSIE